MKIQKLITTLFFLTINLAIFAQGGDLSADQAPLTLESISFEELDYTNEDYLRDVIGLSRGATWDSTVKASVKKKVEELKDVIASVTISEEIIEGNRVNVTITVNEKIPILPIPYFSWSLGGGFVPKFTLRFYNLAGRRKRLITKLQFLPLEHIYGEISYEDKTIFTDERLKLLLKYHITSSIINYNIYSKPLYMGAIGSNATKDRLWNRELFLKNYFETNVTYKIPDSTVSFNPYAKIEHKRISKAEDGSGNHHLAPIDDLDFSTGLNVSFALPNGITFKPETALAYKMDSDNSSDLNHMNRLVKGHLSHGVSPSMSLTVDFPIRKIDATISPFTSLTFDHVTNLYIKNEIVDSYEGNNGTNELTLKFGVVFEKKKETERFKHTFSYKTTFIQPLLKATYSNATGLSYGSLINTLKIQNELIYKMEFMIYERHQLNFRVLCFGNYNDTYEPGGYSIGERPGNLTGWVGLLFNLSYYLPLFSFTTPRVGSFSIDKELKWYLFWDFFIDAGVGQNYEATSTTINLNHLHLAPALAVGTKFRIVPEFMPVYFEIAFGIDAYTMLKTRDFGGSIQFSFGFPDNF